MKVNVTLLVVINRKISVVSVFRTLTTSRQIWLMHFQFKMPENGRKHIFREKKTTNNVNITFLAVLRN